jgi:hypothetical protein
VAVQNFNLMLGHPGPPHDVFDRATEFKNARRPANLPWAVSNLRRLEMGRITSFRSADERYSALRIIGVLFSGIGAILLATGALLMAFGLYALLAGPPSASGPFAAQPQTVSTVPLVNGLSGVLAAVWSLGLLVSGLQFLAIGTLFRLAIHAEENTRASAQLLEKILARLEPREENVGPLFRS